MALSRPSSSRRSSSRRVATGIPMPLMARVSPARIHSATLRKVHAATPAANDSTTDWAP